MDLRRRLRKIEAATARPGERMILVQFVEPDGSVESEYQIGGNADEANAKIKPGTNAALWRDSARNG